jgi:hypothetical protein
MPSCHQRNFHLMANGMAAAYSRPHVFEKSGSACFSKTDAMHSSSLECDLV